MTSSTALSAGAGASVDWQVDLPGLASLVLNLGASGLKRFAEAGIDFHTILCMGEIAEKCPASNEYRRELSVCRRAQRKESQWLYKLVEIGAATNFVADELLKKRAGENVVALMSAILPVMSENSCDHLLLKLFEVCDTPLDKTPGFGQLRAIRETLVPLTRKTQFKDRVFQYHVLSKQLLSADASSISSSAYESIPSEETAVQVILALSRLAQEDSGLILAYHGLKGAAWVIAYARHVLGLPVCVLRSTSKMLHTNVQILAECFGPKRFKSTGVGLEDQRLAKYGLIRYPIYCLQALRKRARRILLLLGFEPVDGSDLKSDEWSNYIILRKWKPTDFRTSVAEELKEEDVAPHLVAGPAWIKSGLGHIQSFDAIRRVEVLSASFLENNATGMSVLDLKTTCCMFSPNHAGIIFVQNAALHQALDLQSCFTHLLPGAIIAEGERHNKIYQYSTHEKQTQIMTSSSSDTVPGDDIFLQQSALVRNHICAIASPGTTSKALAGLYVTEECDHRYYDAAEKDRLRNDAFNARPKQYDTKAVKQGLLLEGAQDRKALPYVWLQAVDRNAAGQWLAYQDFGTEDYTTVLQRGCCIACACEWYWLSIREGPSWDERYRTVRIIHGRLTGEDME
ncbi:hypothetical protein BDR22DRAFT_966380 [Usnea florida]